jgi:arylsulfatase
MAKYPAAGVLSVAASVLLLPSWATAQNGSVAISNDITHLQALPKWPQFDEAPKDAPNIVLILVDDAGFSATSTFGGDIHTPNLDKLASSGLRYNAFAVNAICSPSRSALLSGRNNHQVGFGSIPTAAAPYPGYDCIWPKSAATIAEVLKENGYNTAAFGKWHNTPTWESGPTGPFDRWPTSLGFQYFYGFVNGWDNQYYPRIFRDTFPVEPPATPAEGYNFTDDMTHEAINWLHEIDAVNSTKPFFLYFAPGATHYPLQTPKKWIDKYKGKFDEGWDVLRQRTFERQKELGIIPKDADLTPRPAGVPAWSSLTPDQRKLLARQAEVYAGYTEQADFEIGKLLQAIADEGKAQNTLVLEIFGDNGGSPEGGSLGSDAWNINGTPRSVVQRLQNVNDLGSDLYIDYYAAGWAWEQSTPFQGMKTDASHLGGTRDPLVISWPARIHDAGGLRTQFQHLVDIAPTIYEASGITPPKFVDGVEQLPLRGSSMIYTFDHPDELSHHHVQYFAAVGNRAIYKDGWWAADLYATEWDNPVDGRGNVNRNPWELYNLNTDYSQAHNLAAQYPGKLEEMIQLFDTEAKENQVYPLLPRRVPLPSPAGNRTVFVYRSGVSRIPTWVAPEIVGRPHVITADIEVGSSPAHGVIIAQGDRYGGFTLFVKNGHVIYEVNSYGNRSGQLISSDVLKRGSAHIVLTVTPDMGRKTAALRPGMATLRINGSEEGEKVFPNLIGKGARETLDIGCDLGSPVSPSYVSPDRFNGTIDQVKVELQ